MYKLKINLHGTEVRELDLVSGREYVFGRAANCDVQLEEQQGISRTHFKIVEEGGKWIVQVIAKFGGIQHQGHPVQMLNLEDGMAFQLAGYDFHFLPLDKEERSLSAVVEQRFSSKVSQLPSRISNTLPVAIGGSEVPAVRRSSSNEAVNSFDGNDEATRVFAQEVETPYLRVVERGGREQLIRLEGRRWMAGREDGCDILLDDRKSSRRQFELSSTPQGYFVRDLGSSNGTSLNGIALAHDELKPIRSGDVIQVGGCMVHFEIRDPNFEKKLMVVPPQVRSESPIVVQNPYEMINYPVPTTPGGAVRINDQFSPMSTGRKVDNKRLRFYLIIGVVLVLFAGLLMSGNGAKAPKHGAKVNNAFEKLSPNQQMNVKEIYTVAMNQYMQGKLALAGEQLRKLHEILPEGYETSLATAQECAQQAALEQQLRDLEAQKRRQEEILRTVDTTIAHCEPLSRTTLVTDEIMHCLEPALNLDPENTKIHDLIARVKAHLEEKQRAAMEQKEYRSLVARGKDLYNKAFALEGSGEYLDAMDAYKKHMNSSFPDPEGLKELSRKQALSIQKKMSSKLDDSLKAAEAAYAVGNLREAIDDVLGAKKIDPHSERVAELNGKYRRELNMKMREIYEESVINEGLGNVDGAKVSWKKILDTDHPDGEYFKKAKDKMRTYGN